MTSFTTTARNMTSFTTTTSLTTTIRTANTSHATASSSKKRRTCVFGSSANPPTGERGHVGIVRALAALPHFDEIRVVPVYNHPFSTKRKQLAPFEHRMALCRLAFEGISDKVTVSNAEEMLYQEKLLQRKMQQQEEERKGESNNDNNNSNSQENNHHHSNISIGTADLLEYFQNTANNEECTLCLGADTFLDLVSGKWRRTNDILQLCQGRFIVLYRKEEDISNSLAEHETEYQEEHSEQPCPHQQAKLQQAIDKLNEQYGAHSAQLLHIPTLGSVSSTLIRTLSSASSLGNFGGGGIGSSSHGSVSDTNTSASASNSNSASEQQQQQQKQQRADEYLRRSVTPEVFEYMVQHQLYGFGREE